MVIRGAKRKEALLKIAQKSVNFPLNERNKGRADVVIGEAAGKNLLIARFFTGEENRYLG